jgi:conjugative relaxase-like TrwC/TraI family protein
MLSIHHLSIGSEDYWLNLAAEDYYLTGGEPPGKWCGGGAKVLGLGWVVQPNQLRSLIRGFDPNTGKPLVQNAGVYEGKHRRKPGWDLTFSAPKSVSVAWSQAPPWLRQRIQEIQQRAVERTLAHLEQTTAFSRKGKGGSELIRAKLVVGTYEHGTSRALDPQLHTHCLVLNVAIGEDGKPRTIISRPIYCRKKMFGAYYRAQLAQLLTTELGFRCLRDGESFRIEGVPQQVVEAHSQRRKEIEAWLKEKGRQGAVAAATATLETRRAKQNTPPREELFRRWQELNRSLGFDGRSLPKPGMIRQCVAIDPNEVITKAVENLTRKQSHFASDQLLYETLVEAASCGFAPAGLPEAVSQYLAGRQVIPLQAGQDAQRYTTAAILQEEERLLQILKALRTTPALPVPAATARRVLSKRPTIEPEQADAVKHLTQSRSSIRIVTGFAGTGKTFMIQTCVDAWREQGYRVVGAAPTGKAAQILQDATGIDTETLAIRLGDFETTPEYRRAHRRRQLRRALQGKPTYPLNCPQPMSIDSNTIVVVDEVGMINLRQMLLLLQLVQRGHGILVLLGDPRQLPPVEGGAPFQSLCARMGHASLIEVRRQYDQWAQEAVRLMAQSSPGEAMKMFASRGMLTVAEDRRGALESLMQDWASVALTSPEHAIILVATNQDSQEANRLCQEKRRQAGCLNDSDSLAICDDARDKDRLYRSQAYVGDRILFTKNSRRLGVQNGVFGTVIAVSRLHASIAVKLDGGRVVKVPVKRYRHLRLGYAVTTHKAQGATVGRAFVLVGGNMQDHPLSYVQASRAKESTQFYMERALWNGLIEEIDESPLVRQMSRMPDLTMATDLLQAGRTTHDQDLTDIRALALPPRPKDTADRSRHHGVGKRDASNVELSGAAQAEWDRKTRDPVRPSELRPDDRVRFLHDSPLLQVGHGELATVVEVDRQAQTVQAQLDDGRLVTVAVAEQHITHADLLRQSQALKAEEAVRQQQTMLQEQHETVAEQSQQHDTQESSSHSTTTMETYAPSSSSSSYPASSSHEASASDYASQWASEAQQQQQYQYAGAAQTWTTQQVQAPVTYQIQQQRH